MTHIKNDVLTVNLDFFCMHDQSLYDYILCLPISSASCVFLNQQQLIRYCADRSANHNVAVRWKLVVVVDAQVNANGEVSLVCLKGLPGERYVFELEVKELPKSIPDPLTPYGNREDAYTGPIQSWPMALIREGQIWVTTEHQL